MQNMNICLYRWNNQEKFDLALKISFQANKLIRNNITRSLIIFGINKTEVSYRLLSNISALPSKSHWQSKNFENDFWKVKLKY